MLVLCVKVLVSGMMYGTYSFLFCLRYIGRCTHGSVRVAGASSDRYGAVEVCVNGTWGTVCNEFWDDLDAKVLCRQLGHSQYGTLTCIGRQELFYWYCNYAGALSSDDFSLFSPLAITVKNVSCVGPEDSLIHCASEYVQPLEAVSCSTKAGVVCQGEFDCM